MDITTFSVGKAELTKQAKNTATVSAMRTSKWWGKLLKTLIKALLWQTISLYTQIIISRKIAQLTEIATICQKHTFGSWTEAPLLWLLRFNSQRGKLGQSNLIRIVKYQFTIWKSTSFMAQWLPWKKILVQLWWKIHLPPQLKHTRRYINRNFQVWRKRLRGRKGGGQWLCHCIQYENAQVEEKVTARIKIIFIHFGNT